MSSADGYLSKVLERIRQVETLCDAKELGLGRAGRRKPDALAAGKEIARSRVCLELYLVGQRRREQSALQDVAGMHNGQAAGLSPPCYSGAGPSGGSSLVVWRGLCLCEGLESSWIVMGRVTSHGPDFETD
jgi:hypothetical protein